MYAVVTRQDAMSVPQRTVWQVIQSADPELGGTSKAVVEIAGRLSKRGVRTVLLARCGNDRLRADRETWSMLTAAGVFIGPNQDEVSMSQSLRRHITAGDIVHIHGVWEPCLWRAASLSRRRGVPYIVCPHGMLDRWSLKRSRFKKRLAMLAGARTMLARASAIQCLTDKDLADTASLNLPAKLIRISNGVEVPERFASREDVFTLFPGVLQGKRIVLFLARIHPKKGLDLLIEAMRLMGKSHPDCVLVVAGAVEDRAYEARCRALAKPLLNRVFWTGHVSGDRKRALLSAAALFVLPSFQEGFSLSILEALSMGTPVVISHQCSFPEVSQVGAGVIVGTVPADIAEAMSQMLFKGPEALQAAGLRGKQLVERDFTWDRVIDRLLLTYRQLGALV